MKLTIAFRLAIATTILIAPYCQAEDYLKMVKGLMGKNSGGFMGQATGLMGNSGMLGKASGLLGKNAGGILGGSGGGGGDTKAIQATIITNLNTRQAQLESQIQAGATSGQLSTQEEAELKSDLNRIAGMQGQYLSSGTLSGTAVESLLSEYNNITIKLQTYLSNQTVATGSTYNEAWFNRHEHGNQTGIPADQTRFQANVDTKQAVIDSSINQAVMAGTLNITEATTFRNRLNGIADTECKLLADGSMSYSNGRTLISSLTELETQVNAGIKARQAKAHSATGAEAGQSFVIHRIYRGIASGRLTEQEASNLMRDAHRVEDLEIKLNQSKGMTLAEQRVLIGQINQLNNKITKDLDTKQVQ